MTSTPKPIQVTMPIPEVSGVSPASSAKTMGGSDDDHLKRIGENEKGYESALKLSVPAWPPSEEEKEEEYDDDDIPSEIPNIPTEPDTISRKSRARSFVGGFVSGLRSIPRAVTHSSMYERRTTTVSSKYTSRTESQFIEGADAGVVHPQLWYRVPPPPLATLEHGQLRHGHHPHALPGQFPYPILLAHPPAHGVPPLALPHREPQLSTIGSSYYDKPSSMSGSITSRLGDFLGELSSMPWISPPGGRVAVDYHPGEAPRARLNRSGSNGSWYSINPPSTPSDISDRGKYVPEPWFPPAQLPPHQEVDEYDGDIGTGGNGKDGEPLSLQEKLKRLQEELHEKTMEVENLRRVVEHNKVHIGALETEISELKEAQEQQADIRRRRSSTRKSLSGYRKRDSVRTVMSMRKTMTSVSRPASSFYED